MERTIVGIDVGTTKICTLVGEVDEARVLRVVGVGVAPARGIRKGVVVNITGGAEVRNSRGYVGRYFDSTGVVTVDGAGSTWTNGDLRVGNRGSGTLNVTGGATVILAMGAGRRAATAMKAHLGIRDTDIVYRERATAEQRTSALPNSPPTDETGSTATFLKETEFQSTLARILEIGRDEITSRHPRKRGK